MNSGVVDNHLQVPLIWWIGTLAWFIFLLSLDLFFHKKGRDQNIKYSFLNTIIWVFLALILGGVIWLRFGSLAGLKFFSGYLIEESMSIDNIFVWGIILSYFAIPRHLHYKALFYGIFGAMIFRGIFIFLGLKLINNFQFILIILGIIIIYSGFRAISNSRVKFNLNKSILIRFIDWLLPVSKQLEGDKLIVKSKGKHYVTLLFFVICVIELTDIFFAIDSVPAVISVVRDPYLVLVSNISAILGLRSLYFIFEAIKNKFWLLNKGVAIILIGIGLKMLISPERIFNLPWFDIQVSVGYTLFFILIVISISIFGSLFLPRNKLRV